jgi:hypothetical protein
MHSREEILKNQYKSLWMESWGWRTFLISFRRKANILSDNMSNTEQILIPNVSHDLGLMSSLDNNIFNSKVMQFFARHN